MNIIFLGAPGAGKGTQAEVVSKKFSIPTISTGNIIREALAAGTEMGKKAKEFTESGRLVPDDVVIGIIKERLASDDCKNGFILDGFPRTIPQAEALDSMGVRIDKVVEINVPDEVITERMVGRRVCLACGSVYNLSYKKPAEEGICDNCGSKLVQRKDDSADTVKNRLDVYHKQTEPLKDFYSAKNMLKVVDGQGNVAGISKRIIDALED